MNGMFVNENTYIGCGYDNAPMIFKKAGDNWEFKGSLDDGIKSFREAKISNQAFERTALFESVKADANCTSRPKATKHENYINCTQPFVLDGSGNVTMLSTSDPNGFINYWPCEGI